MHRSDQRWAFDKLADFPAADILIPFGLAAIVLVGAATEILLNGWLTIGFLPPSIATVSELALAWRLDTRK